MGAGDGGHFKRRQNTGLITLEKIAQRVLVKDPAGTGRRQARALESVGRSKPAEQGGKSPRKKLRFLRRALPA
jgi:hypothetical protein